MRELPLILTLDAAGNPMRWITYQDACTYYAKDLVAWALGEQNYTIYGGTRRIDGERSSLTFNSIIAVKGHMSQKALTRAHTPPLTNRALFRRDRHICAYCGDTFSPCDLTRDHVNPVSQGGQNSWLNVVASCSSCNRRKDARTPEQAGMQLIFIPYCPSRQEYLILQNKKILGDQMSFLMKSVPKHSRLHG